MRAIGRRSIYTTSLRSIPSKSGPATLSHLCRCKCPAKLRILPGHLINATAMLQSALCYRACYRPPLQSNYIVALSIATERAMTLLQHGALRRHCYTSSMQRRCYRARRSSYYTVRLFLLYGALALLQRTPPSVPLLLRYGCCSETAFGLHCYRACYIASLLTRGRLM